MARPTNTQFSVAVHLLTLLAQHLEPGQVVDSSRLAGGPATNPVHVRRILGRLREAGLVRSQSGAGGGWALARPAGEIDLAQVWLAVNGEDPLVAVHTPNIDCTIGRRVEENLRAIDRRALALLLEELGRETVAGVLAGADVPV